jgi:hypothetical protein
VPGLRLSSLEHEANDATARRAMNTFFWNIKGQGLIDSEFLTQ